VNPDVQHDAALDGIPGKGNVFNTGFKTSRRMVVTEDDAAGVAKNGTLEDLRYGRTADIDAADGNRFYSDQVQCCIQHDGQHDLPVGRGQFILDQVIDLVGAVDSYRRQIIVLPDEADPAARFPVNGFIGLFPSVRLLVVPVGIDFFQDGFRCQCFTSFFIKMFTVHLL